MVSYVWTSLCATNCTLFSLWQEIGDIPLFPHACGWPTNLRFCVFHPSPSPNSQILTSISQSQFQILRQENLMDPAWERYLPLCPGSGRQYEINMHSLNCLQQLFIKLLLSTGVVLDTEDATVNKPKSQFSYSSPSGMETGRKWTNIHYVAEGYDIKKKKTE